MSTFYKTKNGYLVKQVWDEEEAIMMLITKENELLQPVFEQSENKDHQVTKKLIGFRCPNGEVIKDFTNDKGQIKNISLQGLVGDIFPPPESARPQSSTESIVIAGTDTKSKLMRKAMGISKKASETVNQNNQE